MVERVLGIHYGYQSVLVRHTGRTTLAAYQHALRTEEISYFEHGAQRLAALCHANGLGAKYDEALALFRWMIAPWGDRPITPPGDGWISNVADDHTPYEFSVVYGGAPEVRLLVEAQGEHASLDGNWLAGKALSERLASQFGASLSRHDRVADLFRPEPGAHLGLWHAASLWRDGPPAFKAYFDSQAQGCWKAPAIMKEALDRLGFTRVWPAVMRMGQRGLELDELRFLAVDLANSADARVKVYWRHHWSSAAELAELVGTHGPTKSELIEFCRAITGSEGPYEHRPLFTCTTFVDPRAPEPYATTLYIPIVAYATNDTISVDRISHYLGAAGLDPDGYRATVGHYAQRSLDASCSLHSYVSLQRRKGRAHVTVYFSPEAHCVESAKPMLDSVSSPCRRDDAEELVRRHEHDIVLAHHPFFSRLGCEPVNLGHLWLICANFWEAIVHDFPARLAHVVARIDDDRIRCILAKQLNDELGEGDFSKAHKPMFRRLLSALEPYRLTGDTGRLLEPGIALSRALNVHIFSNNVYQAVGALMLIEIYGKQVDVRLGAEFRRQHQLDSEDLTWLHLHETLEVDHADDSLALARMLPLPGDGSDSDAKLEAVWAGVDGVAQASFAYFNALYATCYA